METLHFARVTIAQPSAWLFFGFGLLVLTAASRRLLSRFKEMMKSKTLPLWHALSIIACTVLVGMLAAYTAIVIVGSL
jgi:uncharacterized membrane protein YidH (DUF202 family)